MTQGKFKGKPKGSWNPKKVRDKDGNDVMDMPCHIHTKKDEEGNFIYPKHTTRQCRLLIQQFQGKHSKDKEKESDKAEDKEDIIGYTLATLRRHDHEADTSAGATDNEQE